MNGKSNTTQSCRWTRETDAALPHMLFNEWLRAIFPVVGVFEHVYSACYFVTQTRWDHFRDVGLCLCLLTVTTPYYFSAARHTLN